MIFLNRTFIFIFFFLNILNATANDNEAVIEIDQPRFSEKGLDQKSYEIKIIPINSFSTFNSACE